MKGHNKILIVISVIIMSCLLLVGCSTKTTTNPEDIIKDAYGSDEFTISFSIDNLDEPIPSMKYSAKNMPSIPTPNKVGYIFSGWYMDKNFTTPYTDNILYLYMRDVTLYAKWEKEEFLQDGVYDIEISSRVDEIIRKGELADNYPFNDITKDINYEETCIEKSEEGLQLKLQYKVPEFATFGGQPTYTVTPSYLMGDDIHIVETITPDNYDEHTVYFNIDKLDITDTIYLDVNTISYHDPTLTSIVRGKTVVTYRIAIDIDKLIGFSRPFVDPNMALENGKYYLVKTHYNSMAETYNPVFSYISVDNKGNYTLIKPFMPYAGLLGSNLRENYIENYYHRGMSFSPMQTYYRAFPDREYSLNDMNKADYLPSLVNGGYYGKYSVEFHADTGKYYMLYDLGKHLDGVFIVSGATTGFMEMTDAMGRYNATMTLDTDHIIQLADIDYRPLEGNAYVYNDKAQYYPGKLNDLNEQGIVKDNMDKYGISTNLFNFYYSASDIDAPIESRHMYSHRCEIVPSKNAMSRPTSDSRYQIATFDMTTSIYGYDPNVDGRLFGDSMTVNNFGGSGRRETIEIKTGAMLNKGDDIRLETLFRDKVSPLENVDEVKATIYAMNGNSVDYSNATIIDDIKRTYIFNNNVAIEYTYNIGKDNYKTLVYLKEYTAPNYHDGHIKNGHKQYDTIEFYALEYTWGENSGKFKGGYYVGTEGSTYDPIYVATIGIDDGLYRVDYLQYNSQKFTLNNLLMYTAYELNNEFREVNMLYLDYTAERGLIYEIKDGDEVVSSGRPFYDEKGERRPIYNYNNVAREINDIDGITPILNKSYDLILGEEISALDLAACTVYTSTGVHYVYSDFVNSINALLDESGYGIIRLEYDNGFDSYRNTISYNIKVDGKNKFQLTHQDYMFTGYDYIINTPVVILPNGIKLDNVEIDVMGNKYGDRYHVSMNNGQYTIRFDTPGMYDLRCKVTMNYDIEGNRVLNGETYDLMLTQRIEVLDSKKDISVTYITDIEHPFKSDIPYEKSHIDGKDVYCYTIHQLITDSIFTIDQVNYFDRTDDSLYAWSPKPWSVYNLIDAERMIGVRSIVNDPIAKFGTNNVMLYTIWDKGITVRMDMNTKITGQQSYNMNIRLDNDKYKGYYAIYKPSEDGIFVPEGYKFTGWTVLETGEFYSKLPGEPILTREPITIKATFVKELIIRFDVDYKLGEAVEGHTIYENMTTKPPTTTAKDGYKFVGWRLATAVDKYGRVQAIDNTNFDFNNKITIDMVNMTYATNTIVIFVAVFEDADGNEVWQKEVTP